MNSIIKDLPELIANNLISEQTAKEIEKYYDSKNQEQGNSTLMIFGSIGAILVGLGLLLIFAHNWDNFSQSVKTMLAILPLLVSQVFAGFTIFKNKKQLLKDIAGILVFFSVGSSIALVAQIYNIPGSLEGYLLSWTLLCMPLMYLLRSNIAAFLHLGFITYYAVAAGYFETERPWMYLVLLAAFVPFYMGRLKKHPFGRITSLFNFLFPLSLIITLGAFLSGSDEFGFLIYMALLSFIYNTGLLPKLESRNDYLSLGTTGIAFILIMVSFKWIWEDVQNQQLPANYYVMLWAVLFAGAAYMATVAGDRHFYKNAYQMVTLIFPVVFFIGMIDGILAVVLDNIIALILGVITIKQGIDKVDIRKLNFGLLIIAALIICRFFDTNISFAIRGVLFVSVGAGFFVANSILIKKKKANLLKTPKNEN